MKPPDPALVSLGRAVSERRRDLGISQEDLGSRTGIDRTYISGIERGVRNPTILMLLRVSKGLEIRLPDLFSEMEGVDGHAL